MFQFAGSLGITPLVAKRNGVPFQQLQSIGRNLNRLCEIFAGPLRISALQLHYSGKVIRVGGGAGIGITLNFGQAHLVDTIVHHKALAQAVPVAIRLVRSGKSGHAQFVMRRRIAGWLWATGKILNRTRSTTPGGRGPAARFNPVYRFPGNGVSRSTYPVFDLAIFFPGPVDLEVHAVFQINHIRPQADNEGNDKKHDADDFGFHGNCGGGAFM